MTNNKNCGIIALQSRKGEIETEKCVLSNGFGGYIKYKNGRTPSITTELSDAKKFEDKPSAIRFANSSIPKAIAGQWEPVSLDSLTGEFEMNTSYEKVDLQGVYKKINEEFLPIKHMIGNKQVLEKALKEIELAREDLEHYIEFSNLNASEGYLAYKMLKVLRQKRREIKDELFTIDYLQTAKLVDIADNGQAALDGLSRRKYINRSEITKPLFETKKITSKHANNFCEKIKGVA